MDSKKSLARLMVIGLLSISLCSVSANPVPQKIDRQYNGGNNYYGAPTSFNAESTIGSKQSFSNINTASHSQIGNQIYGGQRNTANSIGIRSGNDSSNANSDAGLLIVMLGIPRWLAENRKVSFSLQPSPTFEMESNKPSNTSETETKPTYPDDPTSGYNYNRPEAPFDFGGDSPGRSCPPGEDFAKHSGRCRKSSSG